MKLDVPGRQVVEAGTGSGGLTPILARAVHPTGHVTSYENRSEAQQLARQNLEQFGLASYVTFRERDIEQGFDERRADGVFLDVANP